MDEEITQEAQNKQDDVKAKKEKATSKKEGLLSRTKQLEKTITEKGKTVITLK